MKHLQSLVAKWRQQSKKIAGPRSAKRNGPPGDGQWDQAVQFAECAHELEEALQSASEEQAAAIQLLLGALSVVSTIRGSDASLEQVKEHLETVLASIREACDAQMRPVGSPCNRCQFALFYKNSAAQAWEANPAPARPDYGCFQVVTRGPQGPTERSAS
jgi:hypothetical protein